MSDMTDGTTDLTDRAEGSPAATANPRRRSLWHHADYMKIWSAATISLFGSQVSQLAIPFIAAFVLRAPVFEVALLGAIEMLPFLLFALPAGAWLDRVRRRPVLIAGDFGRALVLLTIPIAYVLGALTIWQLYAVGFAAGTLTVLFDVADQSYLPALLDTEDLIEGNAKLQIPGATAQIAGPTFAGTMISLVAAPFAVTIDAASFVVSGGLISLIRKSEPKPQRRRAADGSHTSMRQEISEGLRYVLGNRYLRMIAGSTGTSNLGTSLAFAVFPVFAYVELGLTPLVVGVAFGLGAAGGLLGAVVTAPMVRRLGLGPTIIVSMLLSAPAAILIALLTADAVVSTGLLLAAAFLMSVSAVVYNVTQVSFRQAITPLDMQGRMNATMRFIVWGTMPLGSIAGGILASFLPLRTTILIGAAIVSTAFLWLLAPPVRSLREIPTAARGDSAGSA